jgi:Spy/CpxP family protein refolding chaperone
MSATDPAPAPARAPRRTLLIATVVVVLAFVAGVIVGVVGTRVWQWRGGPPRLHVQGVRVMSDRMVHRLDRELDLSDEQRAQIEKILEARTMRIDGLWTNVGPQVRIEIDATNAEIERVLNPEQRAKFQKLKMRFQRRRMIVHPPPPPR